MSSRPTPKNNFAVKWLAGLLAALLIAAAAGGFTLAREVAANGAKIEQLTKQFTDGIQDLRQRVRDLERELRFARRAGGE